MLATAATCRPSSPAGCSIGTAFCPTGCSKSSLCGKTVTKTQSASTFTKTQSASTVTKTASAVTVTSISTIIITRSASVSTLTVTASTSSTPPPACETEIPYVNLFAFADTKCANETVTTVVGIPIETVCNGLQAPPIKFNTLQPHDQYNFAISQCAILDTQDSQSAYFTIDGLPPTAIDCFVSLFSSTDCTGISTNLNPGNANTCHNSTDPTDGEVFLWNSAYLSCGTL